MFSDAKNFKGGAFASLMLKCRQVADGRGPSEGDLRGHMRIGIADSIGSWELACGF